MLQAAAVIATTSPVAGGEISSPTQTLPALIITDGLCPSIAELNAGALHELVALGSCENPLAAIGMALEEQRQRGVIAETLHLVAHGQSGAFQLGGHWISADDLIREAGELARWQVSTIALWSCELAADPTLVTLLEEFTGATVWASETTLGAITDSQGDLTHRNWSLSSLGEDRGAAPQAFTAQVLQGWNHTLALVSASGLFKATFSYDPTGFFGEETSKVDINTTPVSLTGVTFSQAGQQFSGNNVLGTITYGTATISNALASRPIKVNGVVKGFYCWIDKGTAGQADAADEAWILSFDNSYFLANPTINSSSDRVDRALNGILATQLTGISVSDVIVTEGTDQYAVFTVTNSKTTSQIVNNYTLLLGLSSPGYTATLPDFIAPTQYSTNGGITWAVLSTPYSIAGSASLLIRVPIVNDVLPESTETFALALNVGNGSNATDVIGVGTILDNDGASPAPTVAASQSFDYTENQVAGATVGTVQASDDQAVISFRFAGGLGPNQQISSDGYFQIDDAGNITITALGAA